MPQVPLAPPHQLGERIVSVPKLRAERVRGYHAAGPQDEPRIGRVLSCYPRPSSLASFPPHVSPTFSLWFPHCFSTLVLREDLTNSITARCKRLMICHTYGSGISFSPGGRLRSHRDDCLAVAFRSVPFVVVRGWLEGSQAFPSQWLFTS